MKLAYKQCHKTVIKCLYVCHTFSQTLMAAAEKTPNVVKACNRDRLYEELEDLQARLAVCEKALAEYLETKRLAFPRFYFISSADLLDILSKGNQPVQVCLCMKLLSIYINNSCCMQNEHISVVHSGDLTLHNI